MDLNELPGAAAGTAFVPAPLAASWGLADVLRGIGLAVLGSVVVLAVAAIAVAVVNEPDSDAETLAVLIPNVGLEAVLFLVPLRYVLGKHRGAWRDLGFRAPQRGGFWLVPLLVVGGWLIVGAYFALLDALGLGGLSDQQQLPDRAFESPALIAVVGILALGAAPLCEETFFRGFVFRGLLHRWRFPLAALASGFLFALAHIYPVLYVPFALIGALFAFGYFYSGSLWVPMAAHLLFNGISFAVGVLGSA